MFKNRKKDRTYLKVENGKIIELDESKKENWDEVQNKRDEEIKQQKYIRLEQRNIEQETNGTKKVLRKYNKIFLKIALFIIFIPILIVIGYYLYLSFSSADKKVKENIEVTSTIETIQTEEDTEKTTKEVIQSEVSTEKITEQDTERTITIEKPTISERQVNVLISNIDKYNTSIYNTFNKTKSVVNDVLYNYGDYLLSEITIESQYKSISKDYKAFLADANLQDSMSELYNILDKRYKNVINMTKRYAEKLEGIKSEDFNKYIETNNNLLKTQVEEEKKFLDKNRIKYSVDGLKIQIES